MPHRTPPPRTVVPAGKVLRFALVAVVVGAVLGFLIVRSWMGRRDQGDTVPPAATAAP